MSNKITRIGDIVFVGHFGEDQVIGHYLAGPPKREPLVQFYRCSKSWTVEQGLSSCRPTFPPVIVGILIAVRTGRWSVIGHINPGRVPEPLFLMSNARRGAGEAFWWLRRDGKQIELGTNVPEKYRTLEVHGGWSAELIEERIATGVDPFGYEARMKWGDDMSGPTKFPGRAAPGKKD